MLLLSQSQALLMSAIATCQATLTAKIEAVQLVMRQDIDKLQSRVMETEQLVGLTEDTVTKHSSALRALQAKLKALEYKADDAENRNRRNNLCIVGLAGVEGTNPTQFEEDLLLNLLLNAQFSPIILFRERIMLRPSLGLWANPPCALILRLLNTQDRLGVQEEVNIKIELALLVCDAQMQ